MNDHWLKKLLEPLQNIKADSLWIENNKHKLRAYMSIHPKPKKATLTQWVRIHLLRSAVAFAVIVFCIVTTGVSFASQESLPGDTLFPVKRGLESIQSVFIFSTSARADFEVKRASKRLEEIASLSVRPKSSSSAKAEASKLLDLQLKTATKQIEKLDESDHSKALEVAVNLNSALQANKTVVDVQNVLDTIDESEKRVLGDVKEQLLSTQDLLDSNLNIDDISKREADMKLQKALETLVVAEQKKSNGNDKESGNRISVAYQQVKEVEELLKKDRPIAVASAKVEPSPIVSEMVTASPVSSASLDFTPVPKPIALSTPLPLDTVPQISIEMQSETVTVDEPLIFIVRATNPYKAPLILQWNSACNVAYSIDNFTIGLDPACPFVHTEIVLQPNDSFSWDFATPQHLEPGTHTLYAEIMNYESTTLDFTVLPLQNR